MIPTATLGTDASHYVDLDSLPVADRRRRITKHERLPEIIAGSGFVVSQSVFNAADLEDEQTDLVSHILEKDLFGIGPRRLFWK
jgi:hypothetical protein